VYVASRAEGLQIEVCLCSHWHFDHAGGNRALARRVPGLQVVGGAGDFARTPAATRQVRDLEELTLGRIWMRAHAVPGHTRGSVVWEVGTSADADAPTAAFTGDTLFCGGCGALFESSADELHDSFAKLKSRLRGDCFLYPGHEYTEMLLRMVVRREPFNLAAHKALKQAELARARKLPTVPTTLEQELTYNFHLRCTKEELADLCGCGPA
jgi:hydroxyacylglutathione hydrolase